MIYTEEELLPLSALQHILFCERQCALIHIEQVWAENLFTAEGQVMHRKVHEIDIRCKGSVRVEYSLPIRSLRLGLIGKADVVEFHHEAGESGKKIWRPFPVEYKRGKPKKENWDRVQLCAQALCLEEMLEREVSCGALFYGHTRHREYVHFDSEIRKETEETACRLHALFDSGKTPSAQYTKRCKQCSLSEECQPKAVGLGKSAAKYLRKAIAEA